MPWRLPVLVLTGGLMLLVLSPLAAQCESVGAPMSFSFGSAGRGLKFECTSNAVIDYWSQDLSLNGVTDIDMAVYESTDMGVNWSRIDTDVLVAQPPAGWQFYETTHGRAIPLVAGRWYCFISYICTSGGYGADFGTPYFLSFANINPAAGGIPASAADVGCTSSPTTTIQGQISGFTEMVMNMQFCLAGPTCTINSPAALTTVGGTVVVDADLDHTLGQPVDATYEYSTDSGATWHQCTPATGVNPVLGVATPVSGFLFEWDSLGDGVGLSSPRSTDLRITVDDGAATSSCTVTQLQVDNSAPPPSCTLTLTSSPPVRGVGSFELTADAYSSPTVDVTFEFSSDGGATYVQATGGPGHTNPMLAVPILTPTSFDWDSDADGVGTASVATGVLMRAALHDGSAPGQCTAAPFDVDNMALCGGLCGDCTMDGLGPTILDALEAARIAAGILTPIPGQEACCDVNASTSINVVDALLIAQEAAGLAPVLTCL